MIIYHCQEGRATDFHRKGINRTLPQVDKTRGIKKIGNPKKTLDKRHKMCYNIKAVRTGTSLAKQKMGGEPTAKPKGRKDKP